MDVRIDGIINIHMYAKIVLMLNVQTVNYWLSTIIEAVIYECMHAFDSYPFLTLFEVRWMI